MGRASTQERELRRRDRVSSGLRRYHEVRRRVERVGARDLVAIERSGQVPEHLRPLIGDARKEFLAWADDLGGEDALSAMERTLLDDAATAGVLVRASLIFALRGDRDAASRVSTLMASRRAALTAVGLERRAREVPSLATYLAERSERLPDAPPGSAVTLFFVWFFLGSVAPCGILKRQLRGRVLEGDPSSSVEAAGRVLGTIALDAYVDGLTPAQCVQALLGKEPMGAVSHGIICKACVRFEGCDRCRFGVASTEEEARRKAVVRGCALITSGADEALRCEREAVVVFRGCVSKEDWR